MGSSLPPRKKIMPTDLTAFDETLLSLLEVRNNGESELKKITKEAFINSLRDCKVPLRDLQMLLKTAGPSHRSRLPALLQRPS